MEQTVGIDYEVVHAIPGRIRFRVPSLFKPEAPADGLCAYLRRHPGVRGVRANKYCASVVVDYDAQYTGFADIERALEQTDLDSLKSVAISASQSSATGDDAHGNSDSRRLPWFVPS